MRYHNSRKCSPSRPQYSQPSFPTNTHAISLAFSCIVHQTTRHSHRLISYTPSTQPRLGSQQRSSTRACRWEEKTRIDLPSSPSSFAIAMAVKLRLARVALTRNSPHFTIVAIPSTLRPTARPLETLGTYEPIPTVLPPVSLSPNGAARGAEWGARQSKREGPTQECGLKRVVWNEDRVRWWLERGAEPSKRVERLLISAGILSKLVVGPSYLLSSCTHDAHFLHPASLLQTAQILSLLLSGRCFDRQH